MLPNLKRLSLAETGMGLGRRDPTGDWGYGRRTSGAIEEEARARAAKQHHDKIVENLNSGHSLVGVLPDALRHHWSYLYGRYRDENQIPKYPPDLPNPTYKAAKEQREIVEGSPLRLPAYHGEITFDSPDVYEGQAHPHHWWLLEYVAHNYHGIDNDVMKKLNALGRDAVRYKHGYQTVAVVDPTRDSQRPYLSTKAGVWDEPSEPAWFKYLNDRTVSQSLHFGDSSHYGLAFYWRVSDEIYDYLALAPQLGSSRSERFNQLRMTMQAPWLLEVQADADTGIITPRALFEHLLKRVVLANANVDMDCVHGRGVTNDYQKQFGTELMQYRVRYNMPAGLEEYAPECNDKWPSWSKVPDRVQSVAPSPLPQPLQTPSPPPPPAHYYPQGYYPQGYYPQGYYPQGYYPQGYVDPGSAPGSPAWRSPPEPSEPAVA